MLDNPFAVEGDEEVGTQVTDNSVTFVTEVGARLTQIDEGGTAIEDLETYDDDAVYTVNGQIVKHDHVLHPGDLVYVSTKDDDGAK